MKRSAPMSRGKGFKRPERPARTPPPAYRLARPCVAAVIDSAAVPVPKAVLVRSEPYRRLVAALPCIHCGIEGFSNHAHANTGKGVSLKQCDLMAFPLCVDRPGVMGCHTMFDQHALFAKAGRRVIELEWARRTVRFIVGAGLMPAGLTLPDWAES